MSVSSGMSEYDSRAWASLIEGEQTTERSLLPAVVRNRLQRTGEVAKRRIDSIPGSEKFQDLLMKALGGFTDLGSRAARASVRSSAVVKSFQKRGHAVESIEDIRKLPLKVLDDVKPRLDIAYISASTVQGAAAGLAVSGGELLGLASGGAPGAGVVVGAMAADAAAVLVASQRAVAHVAAYYGYDLTRPEEQMFALGVLNLGTSSDVTKAAAYLELNKLVQGLARKHTWDQLRQNVVTKVVEQVYAQLGIRLTQRKLGQAVPVVGVLIGAGMNAKTLSRVVDDAEHAYRKRHLQEKYGIVDDVPLPTVTAVRDDTIPIVDILDAEIVEAEPDVSP
ncbi:EcsC family protein [Umezawaea sp.]|uniref:EcsC family protein n=1 Tax=Umezawaea sp. TaxID=1955258 RepID=UPI002ED6231D